MNLSTKQTHRHRKQKIAIGEGVGGGMEWEVGVSRRKLLYTEWINKVLLYSAENYINIL